MDLRASRDVRQNRGWKHRAQHPHTPNNTEPKSLPVDNLQFNLDARCELLPYLLTLPLGLSRKKAKDLLRFRAVTVKRLASVRHDTQLEPGDVVTIAAGKQISNASIERHGLKIVYLD